MRGIKAVLYVAVLVCLISSSFAASCNKGKASDDNNGCICKSGYSPADSCAALINAACVGAELSRTEANHFPSLSTAVGATSFVSNTLNAKIEAEYVADRQYEEVKFTPLTGNSEEAQCNLGNTNSWWTQAARQISGPTCNDSFTLALPWAEHPKCGFANNTGLSDGNYMYITGYLHIKYTDALGEVENFTLTRSTKVPYSITVKFQKHVTVQLKALNVTSDVHFGMALTEDVYDPVKQILTLELTTIINWPNVFHTGKTAMYFFVPHQVDVQTVGSTDGLLCAENPDSCDTNLGMDEFLTFPQRLDGTCSNTVQDSICKQSFTWKTKLFQNSDKNCSFDGDYNLQIPLYTCRAPGGPAEKPTCTNELKNISFTIQDSFVCGEIGVTPSVSGHLYAFPPTVTSNFRAEVTAGHAINQFKLGTYGHFYAQIESDDNLISLNFTQIRFKTQETGASWTNLWNNDVATQSQYLQIFDNSKYFRIYFHSSTFKVNPNSQVVYTFSATAEIAFEGNPGYVASPELKKRTVEYTWTQASAEATTNVFMAPASNAVTLPADSKVQESAGVSSVTFIASVVGAVAGTMIIVFVVVGLALRARSSKEEVSSSLLAASAAASEVANRA